MQNEGQITRATSLAPFDRRFFSEATNFTYIGAGELGGKAHGLAKMKDVLENKFANSFAASITVGIPTLSVITTEYFDLFLQQNGLEVIATSGERDEIIANAFQNADLPAQLAGDLRALVQQVHTPLAVRSSSLLEDAIFEPFAGVYATKMIPNNQPDADTRFKKLTEAIKLVYASTFFRSAQSYMAATRHKPSDEKMSVIIQEVVGSRFGDRFYPEISGVIRSFNFYPVGDAAPEDGVIELALGLGRTIVDEGVSWSYSPSQPRIGPPFKTTGDLLKHTQTKFWAINMGKPPVFNPLQETEYMAQYDLQDSEYDGTLQYLASTYDYENDHFIIGTGKDGPRVLDFGPILKTEILPLNDLLRALLKCCEDELQTMVEIEFAVRLSQKPAQLGFLQVRPMVVSDTKVNLSPNDCVGANVLLASDVVLGNGILETIKDIVFVDPKSFDILKTREIAMQIEEINRTLVDAQRPYLLIGFGRWGTTDPYGGIPVDFGQISGAKVIVESSLPNLNLALSQGSHFFHNVTSLKILYLSLHHEGKYRIDWNWLEQQPLAAQSRYVKHVQLSTPLQIKVDGRNRLGVILHE